MITQMAERLTGKALLEKARELSGKPVIVITRACGFTYIDEEGNEKGDFEGLQSALITAKMEEPGEKLSDEAKKELELRQQASDEKVLGDMSVKDLDEWWKNNHKPFAEEFGANWDLVQKHVILRELRVMASWHFVQADKAHEKGDEELRAAWVADKAKIEDIMARLMGISLGDGDFGYVPYEEKQASDPYLSGISDDSLDVLKHFGGEAPALLNKYSCAVEDALIEQVQRCNELAERIKELTGEAPELDGESVRKALELKNAMRGDTQSSEHECPEPNWKTTQENK